MINPERSVFSRAGPAAKRAVVIDPRVAFEHVIAAELAPFG